MIRYLENHVIDYEKWDACINKAFNGNLYAWSWYLDIVHEGWGALVQGDYETVMPVTSGKKYGISYLYQPPFTQQLGLFSTTASSGLPADDFLEALFKHFQFAEINLNRFNKVNHPDCKVTLKKNYELELIDPYEKLRSRYASNTLRNIKKAIADGISIQDNVEPLSIISMFQQEKGKEIKRLGTRQYNMLEKLVYRGIYKKNIRIAGAFDKQNQLCAGVFLFESHKRLVFLFSANNQTARQSGAMHLLVDNLIRQHAGKALTLDFEGSQIPGLARFYAGFGSAETNYPTLYYNRLSLPLRFGIKAAKFLGLK